MHIKQFPIYLITTLLIAFSAIAYGQPPDSIKPQNPPKLVNDFAEAMGWSEVLWLEDKLVKFDKQTSNQICIVTIKSLEGYEIAQYAAELGNHWGIGNKGKDNGVLILVAIDDRTVNISPGYGLEGALPDAVCGKIIRNEIVPEFKKGLYYSGLDNATDAIISATKGEYTGKENYYDTFTNFSAWPRWLIILVLIVGINGTGIGIFALINYLYYKITGKKPKTRSYDYSPPKSEEKISGQDSSSSSGSDHEQFGGYGGGSFGGGGASGKW